jgi:hypothetical protein
VITDVLISHAQAAMDCYEIFGTLKPKLWAVAPSGASLVAEPLTAKSEASEPAKQRILSAMVHSAAPAFIGRCDEVWFSAAHLDRTQALEALAEEDPRIRTGIQAVALDCKRMVLASLLVEPFLDDDGTQRWRQIGVDAKLFAGPKKLLVQATKAERDDLSLIDVSDALGWAVFTLEGDS